MCYNMRKRGGGSEVLMPTAALFSKEVCETMKKLIAAVLSVALLAVSAFAFAACGDGNGDKPTLTVYTNAAFAPYEYMNDNGEIVGVDIDIAYEIGDVLGYNIEVRDVDFGAVFTNVQADPMSIGIAGITINAEREATGIFSVEYATSIQYAIIPSDMNVDANKNNDGSFKLSALAGKRIGVQESTTGNFLVEDAVNGTEDEDTGEHVKGELEDTNASCITYSNGIVAGENLGGQIDCLVIDQLPAESIAEGKTGYSVVKLDAEPESYGIYLNKEATELRDDINKVLQTMIDTSVIEYFTLKHSGAII